MCNKTILENGGTLESVPDYYKNQQMCDKVVDNYPHALKFVPDCYMTQKMCDKAVNTHAFIIEYVPDQFKKRVIKRLIDVFLYLILFPINMRLKKCVTELFLKILF